MKSVQNLYYICHCDNLTSILQRGIYCRQKVNEMQLNQKDIHDESVLARRNKTVPLTKKNLQDYVNLYFQPRNAMLYRLTRNYPYEEIIVLSIKSTVLENPDALVSNRNAAADNAEFFSARDGLKKINHKDLEKTHWTDSDDSKQKMMAEVLVPEHIAPEYVDSIYVGNARTRDKISKIVNNFPNVVNDVIEESDIFFLPTLQRKIAGNLSISKGDMFFSNMQTFTISVNIVGVMGKGLASRAKYQFPHAYVIYQDHCKSKKLKIGKPTLFRYGTRIEEELADYAEQLKENNINGVRWLLFFPTKRHWREDSRLEDIEESLQWLVKNYEKQGIESIAMPALGCGLGNLDWSEVGPMMCHYLAQMSIKSCIYLPVETPPPNEQLTPDYLLSRK